LRRFDLLLEEDVSGYKGKFSELIHEAPALYRLMVRLLDDHALPDGLSPMIIAAIAYFITPADVIPEEKFGPEGYVDDIYLCAFVADQVMKAAGIEDILIKNWSGKMQIVPLVKEVLSREKELIGDKREQIMEFIGYNQLGNLAQV
jgi:uncharacterized membrane protein YkvA (DUF1232 family)